MPEPIDEAVPLANEEADIPASLQASFRVLELATLSLDGIAHDLTEARMLARIAARPEGAAQRGLITARYAFLKEQIERRAAEAAISNGDSIAIALGAEEDGRQGSLMSRALPKCGFANAEEARALVMHLDKNLRAVDDEATRLREAAGQIADNIANNATGSEPRPAAKRSLSAAAGTGSAQGRHAA